MHDPEDNLQEKIYIPQSLDPDYESDEEDPVRAKAIFASVAIAFLCLFILFFGVVDEMEQTGYLDDHIRAAHGYPLLAEAQSASAQD